MKSLLSEEHKKIGLFINIKYTFLTIKQVFSHIVIVEQEMIPSSYKQYTTDIIHGNL